MTKNDLSLEMVDLFPFAPAYLSDDTYALMEEASFLKTSPYMKWILRIFNTCGWKEKFDCDDFAMLWKILTSLRHSKSKIGESQGVACGIVWFRQEISGIGHAINIVKTENGWRMFDPQSEQFIDLSEKERKSAWFVLF